MPTTILRSAAFLATEFVEQRPYRPGMHLHEQLAAIYASRVPGTVQLVELACGAQFPFEALGLVRPLFEMFVKLAYVAQRSEDGSSPTDVAPEEREPRAWHVFNFEIAADKRMFDKLEKEMPGHFDADFLQGLGRAGARAKMKDATGGVTDLKGFARCGGVLREYDGYYGTLSHPAHGTVNGARISITPSSQTRADGALRICALYALALIRAASDLVDDRAMHDRAHALQKRLTPPT